jgi:hypothetical protein
MWKIDNDASNHNNNNPPEYVCRILSYASDEGIRHCVINSLNYSLTTIVGDAHCKYWLTATSTIIHCILALFNFNSLSILTNSVSKLCTIY